MEKKLLYLLLLFSGIASAQIVDIPDINFKNKLLSASTSNNVAKDADGNTIVIDTNGDYEIQEDEALLVYELRVNDSNINDLTGIEAFTNVKLLVCDNNPGLTSLDLSGLINLEHFICDGGTALEYLSFSGLSNLEIVSIVGTNLTTIDLTGTTAMENLKLQNVPVVNIDFSSMPNLTQLELNNTNLINIDLSNSSFLPILKCIGNTLLETINIKNGNSLFVGLGTDISDNPNLDFICLDEGEEVFIEEFIGPGNNPSYSSYCSFTPGGDFNTITGTAVFDTDSDGCDTGDFPYSFVKLSINNGADEEYAFTNTNGEYSFYTQDGGFTITPEFEDNWFTVTPASVNFPEVDGSVSIQNFCIEPNGVHNDVEVVMVPVVPARPGFDAVYKIVYKNKGNQVVSGSVGCEWNYDVLTYVALEPMAEEIGLGTYTWNYTNLQPFENREILMTLHVNGPTDTPAVNIDDVLPFTANIVGGADETPDNNQYVLDQAVVGAFDPNNIICIQGETASVDDIGNYLHYVVNFENTGTATASFVVIKHVINEADFDIASLQILNSSHQVQARIKDNIIEFIFNNISLNALDHGNILFKLKSKSDLEEGDQVMNQANIYFDYNFPVETNEAITEFGDILGTSELIQDTSVKVYPNPATDMITVIADDNLQSVSLYDIQGRLLQTQTINDKQAKFDISEREKGVYFLKIITDKGINAEKIIKE